MNFKNHLRKFKHDQKVLSVKEKGVKYTLVRCETGSDDPNFPYRYYAISLVDTDAHNSTEACIRKAYRIDPQTGDVELQRNKKDKKIYAAKISSKPLAAEAEITAYYSNAEKLLKDDKDRDVLISEYFPGEELINDSFVANEKLAKLDFSQAINLIWQIMLRLNLMHHAGKNDRKAIVHRDLKGPNIKFTANVEKNKKGEPELITDVFPLDYGTALPLENEDGLVPCDLQGTPYMIAPDIISQLNKAGKKKTLPLTSSSGEVGVKTDLYAIVPIFYTILGATDPYANRKEPPFALDPDTNGVVIDLDFFNKQIAAGFDANGLFSKFVPIQFELSIGDKIISQEKCATILNALIQDFLARMASAVQSERPSSDEALHLFTALNILSRTVAIQPENQSVIQACFAKMLLLRYDCWKQPLAISYLPEEDTKQEPGTFENFDFAGNEALTQKIIKAMLSNDRKIKIQNLALKLPSEATKIKQAAMAKLKDAGLYQNEFEKPLEALAVRTSLNIHSLPAIILAALLDENFLFKLLEEKSDMQYEFIYQYRECDENLLLEFPHISEMVTQLKEKLFAKIEMPREVRDYILLNVAERHNHLASLHLKQKLLLLKQINSHKTTLVQLLGEENYQFIYNSVAQTIVEPIEDQISFFTKNTACKKSEKTATDFVVSAIKESQLDAFFQPDNSKKICTLLKSSKLSEGSSLLKEISNLEQRELPKPKWYQCLTN